MNITIRIHMYIGHLIERFDRSIAMNYFMWVMKPYNKSPLFDEWERLWTNTKISDLIETGNIDLTHHSKEELKNLMNNKDLTFNEYFEMKRKSMD